MAAPVIRQSNGNGASTGSTTITQALASAVLAGSRLYAWIVWGAATGVVQSVSDTINGTNGWVQVPNSRIADSGGPTQGELWTNANSAAGAAPTITATYGNGSGTPVSQTFRAIIFGEMTGADLYDKTILISTKDQTTAVTSMTSNNITTVVPNCLILCACSNDTNTVVPTAGPGFVIDKTTTTQVIATEKQTKATAGVIGGSFSFGTAAAGVIIIAAFRPFIPLPAPVTVVKQEPEPDFPGDVVLLKSVVVASAPPPPTPLPVPHVSIVQNLDGDTFAGDVLQLKAPLVPPVVVTLARPSTFLVLNLGDDSYPGEVIYLRPPTRSNLQVPSTFLFLNRGDDTYPGSVQYFKAPPVAAVATPSLPVPATFLFLSRGDDSFPGAITSMRSIITPVTPTSSILQRRTLHAFGTHAGGRTSRGDS